MRSSLKAARVQGRGPRVLGREMSLKVVRVVFRQAYVPWKH